MATPEDKMKDRVLESYVPAGNNFFHWVSKWFYSDLTVSEGCDCILYTAYKFSYYGQINPAQTVIHVNLV